MLADLFFGISVLAYAAWNVGLVLLFIFGLQGMAIVLFLFEKDPGPPPALVSADRGARDTRRVPGRGVFIVLAIPVLGISEN